MVDTVTLLWALVVFIVARKLSEIGRRKVTSNEEKYVNKPLEVTATDLTALKANLMTIKGPFVDIQ